jgi:fatty acid desaturase
LVKKGESFTQKLSTQEKLAFIATLAFWIGLAVNLTVVFTAPSVLNWLILIAYIYLVFVRHIMIGGKEWGIVLNSNNKPMPFTVIKLIDSNKNQMYARAVSDEKGRYMMIGKPGKYSLEGSANGERLSFKPSLLSIRKRKAIKEELVGN